MKTAKEMDNIELTKWFALMNALKYVNLGEDIYDQKIDAINAHEGICKYVESVSGDMLTYLREWGGVPYKYSLDSSDEESKQIDELDLAYY